MTKQYRKEKFTSRDEAIIWCADKKPIYDHINCFDSNSVTWSIHFISNNWQQWHKAIEIEKKEPIKLYQYLADGEVVMLNENLQSLHFDGTKKEFALSEAYSGRSYKPIKLSNKPILLDPDTYEVINMEEE